MLITCTTVVVADNNTKNIQNFEVLNVTVHAHYVTTVPGCSQLQWI